MNTICTSKYTREREQDGITYTCTREVGHPGVHDAGRTETVEVFRAGEFHKVEAEIQWSDWEEFLAAQRTSTDARVLELGARLAGKEAHYPEMLARQPRYAKLTA
ncbi:hypothetical protein AB0J01_27815 [Streptomyces sp. NPDC050204]|uniref:hypothetical protein n=1 Tax=Streptomyces sp. NPDC050204 TaxID=3155514 RepID=UPI00343E00E9